MFERERAAVASVGACFAGSAGAFVASVVRPTPVEPRRVPEAEAPAPRSVAEPRARAA